MKLFGLLNLIAGVVAIAGILAGLIVQFQNRQEIRKLNHAVSYYFTIRLSQFSYSEVQQDYASAARKIQSQLEYALNGATNGADDSPQHKRQKREIHCCKGASITILGIADDQRGGVAVVSGMSYTANNAPKLHELKAKINSMFGATVEKTIDNREPSAMLSPMCIPLENITDTTTTTFKTPTTCPPCPTMTPQPTPKPSSSSTTTTSSPPPPPTTTTTSPPPPTTTTSTATSTTTTKSHPTLHPGGLPCDTDVAFYLDRSTAVTNQQYAEEVAFLTNKLASRFYVMPSWTDASIGAYGKDGAPWFGGFWYHHDADFRRDLKNMSNIGSLGPPSVTEGFKAINYLISNRQRFGHVASYTLFTATSETDDLKQVKSLYSNLTQSVNIVGIGSQFNSNNFKTILGVQPIIATRYDDALADEILDKICPGYSTATTPKPKPGLGCGYDVLIGMDLSSAVPTQTYINEVEFVRKKLAPSWNINPWETEVAVGTFQAGMASWGAYAFQYENAKIFDEMLGLYSSKRPGFRTDIKQGMEYVKQEIDSNRRKNKKVASLIFLYNATVKDVEAAVPLASDLAKNGDRFIIVAPGSANAQLFEKLSTEVLHVSQFDESAVYEMNKAICTPQPTRSTPKPTTTTGPTPHPGSLPCDSDVAFYLDRSTAVTNQQYAEEVAFLTNKLASRFYVMPTWTDASIGAYGKDGAPWFGGFWYHNDADFRKDLKNMSNIGSLGPPSVTEGFKAINYLINNRQRLVASYTLFTATSETDDLKQVKSLYSNLTQLVNIVGIGSQFNSNNFKTILGVQPIIATRYDDALADEILDNTCPGYSTATTPKPKPGLGCDYDVLIGMDLSGAVPTQTYLNEVEFVRKKLAPSWNINPWETEVAVGTFQGGMASWGAHPFQYANAKVFDEMVWMYSSERPGYRTDIKQGMEFVKQEIDLNRRRNKKVASLIFLYNTTVKDVEAAVPLASNLAKNGDRFIIVAPGSANAQLFEKLSTEVLHVSQFDESAVHEVNKAICTPQPTRSTSKPTTTATAKPRANQELQNEHQKSGNN